MMLPEEEARTKVCPLMSPRGDDDGPGYCKCIASRCMKWRWVPGKSPDEVASWDPCKTGPKGYCGA